MTTMREFKQGDKVVCVRADGSIERGKTYTVMGYDGSLLSLRILHETSVKNTLYKADRFMHEREYVEMCLQAIIDRTIIVSGGGDIRKRWDGAWYSSATEFVSEYYPIESPAQKELRELKEQAKELHDKIAALEDKVK